MVMTDLIPEYLGHLVAAGYSPKTVREREYLLRRVDQDLPYGLEQAATVEIETWLGGRRLARWSLARYHADLRGFYDWTVRSRVLDWSPMQDMPRPRVPRSEPRPATDEQVAAGLRLPSPWRTAVVLAACNGLRCSEIARLQREHV